MFKDFKSKIVKRIALKNQQYNFLRFLIKLLLILFYRILQKRTIHNYLHFFDAFFQLVFCTSCHGVNIFIAAIVFINRMCGVNTHGTSIEGYFRGLFDGHSGWIVFVVFIGFWNPRHFHPKMTVFEIMHAIFHEYLINQITKLTLSQKCFQSR